jgi:kinesin family protein 5
MRAKTITNKAKANVDLSPKELKSMLRKIKVDYASYVTYCGLLEGEVAVWRSGNQVAESDWVSLQNLKGQALSSSPSRDIEMIPRPSTPSAALGSDERDEFLRRENDISDQLQLSEATGKKRECELVTLKEELSFLKTRDATFATV